MLDVRTYTWKDVKNTKIVINSTGTTAKLSEFANSSKTDPIVALESVLKLYGFTNIQINNPTGRNIIFSYDSKYNFLIIQLQNLTINMNVDILNGVIYWKPFQGAATTDYKTWDITNGSLKKTFSTNGEEIYLGYVAEAMSEGSAYLWDNGVDVFSGAEFSVLMMDYKEDGFPFVTQPISSDLMDKNNNIIKQEYIALLAQYAANTRYRIGKQKIFQSVQFNYNIENNNSITHGQYLSTENKTSYWGMKPAVYPIILYDSDAEILSELPQINISYTNNAITCGDVSVPLTSDDLLLFYVRTPSYTIDDTSYPDWRIGQNVSSEPKPIPISTYSSSGSFNARYKIYSVTPSNYQLTITNNSIKNISMTETNHQLFKSIITTNTDNFYFDALIGNDHTGETAWTGIITGNRWESFMSIGTYSLSKNTCTLQSQSNLTFLAKCTFDTLQQLTDYINFGDTEAHLVSISTKINAFGGVKDWKWVCQGSDNYLRRGFSAVSGLFPSQIPYFKEGYVYSNNKEWSIGGTNSFDMKFDCQIGYYQISAGEIGLSIVVWKNGKTISSSSNSNSGGTITPVIPTPGGDITPIIKPD